MNPENLNEKMTEDMRELTTGQLDGVVGGTLIELGVDMVQAAIDIIIGPPEPKKLTGRYTK